MFGGIVERVVREMFMACDLGDCAWTRIGYTKRVELCVKERRVRGHRYRRGSGTDLGTECGTERKRRVLLTWQMSVDYMARRRMWV